MNNKIETALETAMKLANELRSAMKDLEKELKKDGINLLSNPDEIDTNIAQRISKRDSKKVPIVRVSDAEKAQEKVDKSVPQYEIKVVGLGTEKF
jgi:predicted nucleotide-binding protein (sugar kinase/HSP70/actin superfamily)